MKMEKILFKFYIEKCHCLYMYSWCFKLFLKILITEYLVLKSLVSKLLSRSRAHSTDI